MGSRHHRRARPAGPNRRGAGRRRKSGESLTRDRSGSPDYLDVKRNRRLVLGLAALAALLPGCGAARAGARDIPPSPDALVVAVRGGEFGFEPSALRVPAGKLVRLELTNTGAIEHDVMFRRLPVTGVRIPRGQHLHDGDVAAHAAPGKTAWMEFTPTTPGTYELFCTVLGHKEAGMQGTLTVE